MNSIERLGLQPSDFSDEIVSDEQIIDAICTSYRLFRQVIYVIVLEKLRIYFNNEGLQKSDKLTSLFPLKGRRAKWLRFQVDFDMIVPDLGWNLFLKSVMAVYAVASIFLLIAGLSHLSVGDWFTVLLTNTPGTLAFLFFIYMTPLGLIAWFGNFHLPGKTIDDLIDGIITKNVPRLLGEDRAGLKLLLHERLTTNLAT